MIEWEAPFPERPPCYYVHRWDLHIPSSHQVRHQSDSVLDLTILQVIQNFWEVPQLSNFHLRLDDLLRDQVEYLYKIAILSTICENNTQPRNSLSDIPDGLAVEREFCCTGL
jgi:hypothetical protein